MQLSCFFLSLNSPAGNRTLHAVHVWDTWLMTDCKRRIVSSCPSSVKANCKSVGSWGRPRFCPNTADPQDFAIAVKSKIVLHRSVKSSQGSSALTCFCSTNVRNLNNRLQVLNKGFSRVEKACENVLSFQRTCVNCLNLCWDLSLKELWIDVCRYNYMYILLVGPCRHVCVRVWEFVQYVCVREREGPVSSAISLAVMKCHTIKRRLWESVGE